jgi:hypothetical protein
MLSQNRTGEQVIEDALPHCLPYLFANGIALPTINTLMSETVENNGDLGELLVALGKLQKEHLEHPCGPDLMPMYIRMARDFIDSIRKCLEHDASMAADQRERLTSLLHVWDTNLIPGYVESSIEALMREARMHASVHVPPEEFAVFLQHAEERIQDVHKEGSVAA